MGYLFQQYALFPNMSVMQNIQCGIRTGSRAEKQRQAAEQLRRFHLEGLERKYPAQLSGGQQQRAALARILCSEPRVILLDEPFSALDSFLKWNLELELKDLLADFGGPILWVSHDLGECRRNCQTVCVMENGVSAAVTDGAITLTEGAHRAQIRRVIRDLNATVVLLCPVGDTDAPPLRAALPDGMEASEGQTIALSLRAEKCMCYA